MVCKLCPTRKHCWDKGACEDCDFGKAFYALERKIGRLKKKNAELADLNNTLRNDVVELEADVDRLKKDNEYILMQHRFQRRPGGDCWNDVIEKAKSEVIAEFAERIKKEFTDYPKPISYLEIEESGFCEIVDRLAEEMKGKSTNAE